MEQRGTNIVLIGYRGSGKTTVGKLLAARLDWTLVDTDTLVEADAGVSIAEIFATEGEAAFRQRENGVIRRVARGGRQVISVGGGAIVCEENVRRLRACGTVIWLVGRPEVLWERIRADRQTAATRPNLTGTGGLEEVRRVLAARHAAYESAADFSVETDHHVPADVADRILPHLNLND